MLKNKFLSIIVDDRVGVGKDLQKFGEWAILA
jgi:hypothetical protein